MHSNAHLTLAHTRTRERVLLSASTLTVPVSAKSTVLSTLPTGTALHLLLSHWHNKRSAARNTKPERSREKRRDTQTEREMKPKQKETQGQREGNCICSWSFLLQGCLHLTSFTFYHRFLLFFSSFLLTERDILSTPDLSYFSSPDVQYRQIKRQGMMATSSVLRGTEGRRHRNKVYL